MPSTCTLFHTHTLPSTQFHKQQEGPVLTVVRGLKAQGKVRGGQRGLDSGRETGGEDHTLQPGPGLLPSGLLTVDPTSWPGG